jgi:hypothetical protein
MKPSDRKPKSILCKEWEPDVSRHSVPKSGHQSGVGITFGCGFLDHPKPYQQSWELCRGDEIIVGALIVQGADFGQEL